jgi:hypothetical protein
VPWARSSGYGSVGLLQPYPYFRNWNQPTRIGCRVESQYRRMAKSLQHAFLEQVRSVPATRLGAPRFVGRVRIDKPRQCCISAFR